MNNDRNLLTTEDWRKIIANQQANPPPPAQQPYHIAYDAEKSGRLENGFFRAVFGPKK